MKNTRDTGNKTNKITSRERSHANEIRFVYKQFDIDSSCCHQLGQLRECMPSTQQSVKTIVMFHQVSAASLWEGYSRAVLPRKLIILELTFISNYGFHH